MHNLPQGYKQTELGIIPEDWEIVIIKDIADITTGNKNTQDAENDGKVAFVIGWFNCVDSLSQLIQLGEGSGAYPFVNESKLRYFDSIYCIKKITNY